MERITVQDYQVLVLADGDSQASINNAKGHLFEAFIANLLHEFGYDEPHERNVNVTADGIELDVSVNSSFHKHAAIAEGKAYSTNVKAQAVTSFYGKLQMARFGNPELHGYMFALPRLVTNGHESAKAAEANDSRFHYFDAAAVVETLITRRLLRSIESTMPASSILSDPAVVIAADGLYTCVKVLDSHSRKADEVVVWGSKVEVRVPGPTLALIEASDYARELTVRDVGHSPSNVKKPNHPESAPLLVVSVRGSSSDFEYQFPASPEFFVGRRALVGDLSRIVDSGRGTFVFNAQSGWGKSSLALKLKTMVEKVGGYAIIVDSRTAASPLFVIESIRVAAQNAEDAGLLTLPAEASWASLKSALATIADADWARTGPLLIFYDQFENVFQDEETTRQFRDLTLLVNETAERILVGFAWKTDLVGWTESHPYRLRDEIRSASTQIAVGPMGAKDVEALLRRLEKTIQQSLARELRQRLREYSQGLPWLFKKLAGHVIREIEDRNKTQEQLVAEALNIQSLFDSDLAGLSPVEKDAVRHVARFAPVSATEVTDKYDGVVIQSLLDRRLLVAVGEKLDTYWDIFRDFLNTGEIPIEDSYTIGLNPQAVAPVVTLVAAGGGSVPIAELASSLGASPRSLVNVSRTLRLLGITSYDSTRIHLLDAIIDSREPELTVRRGVARVLRRHRAYSLFQRLAERHPDGLAMASYARDLPQAFPAVDAKPNTWATYARAFAVWFEYAGLAISQSSVLFLPPEGFAGKGSILSSRPRSPIKTDSPLLHDAPGPSLRLLIDMGTDPVPYSELDRSAKRALRGLLALGLVNELPNGLFLRSPNSISNGKPEPSAIAAGLQGLPGGGAAFSLLASDGAASALQLGTILRDAAGTDWKDTTAAGIGKHFRSWAKVAGLEIRRPKPNPPSAETWIQVGLEGLPTD